MSLMDLFTSQGEVGPSSGSSRGNLKDWFLNIKGRKPFGRTARPDPDAKRGDWIDWFLNRRGLAGKFGGNERYKYDSYSPYNYQLFQKGGSVNMNGGEFRDRGGRTISQTPPGQPVRGRHLGYGSTAGGGRHFTGSEAGGAPGREEYIWRSNQKRMQDATINKIIREEQGKQQLWEQKGGQGSYPVINQPGGSYNAPVSPGWLQASLDRNNSGMMLALANSPAVNKMKNIYNQVDPFFPEVDIDDQQIGYDFNKNLWGGNLGFGGGYDMDDDEYNAYINWGKEF